jgi:hypothetical protein
MSRCTSSSPILLSARFYFSCFYIHHPRSLASRMVPVLENFDQTSHSCASLTNARCPQSYVACGHCTCECGNNLRTHLPFQPRLASTSRLPLSSTETLHPQSLYSFSHFFLCFHMQDESHADAPTHRKQTTMCARVRECGRMEETREREVDGRWWEYRRRGTDPLFLYPSYCYRVSASSARRGPLFFGSRATTPPDSFFFPPLLFFTRLSIRLRR